MKIYICILLLIASLTLPVAAQYEKETEEDRAGRPAEPGKKTTAAPAQKYRRPLDINNGYSSSFQEFRSSHFHAGMDFRTFQKTGYPVRAIADGVIYKIRMVKRGSGRGLYLKHDDGNTSIYFHLDRFEKKLEALKTRVQSLKGRKYFDNYFLKKPLRYTRGQVIGYSGETGSGFPHLHLEIRDSNYFAINPFKLMDLPSRDTRAPVLRGALLRNIGPSPINGRIGERYLKFKKTSRNNYAVASPLVVTGPFDVVLNLRDYSDSGRPVAPHKISASIDEHFYFNLSFDRFQRDDNNQLGFVYDLERTNSGSYYFNLFPQEGYNLEDRSQAVPPVFNALREGEHRLNIRVSDNYDNITIGTVTFHKIKPPVLEITDWKISDRQVTLEIGKLDAQKADAITLALKRGDGHTVYSGSLRDRVLTTKKLFTLKGSFEGIRFIDFKFLYKGVVYAKRRFLLNQEWLTGITDIDFETFINRDDVFIKVVKPFLSADSLQLKIFQGADSKEIPAQTDGESLYFHFKPLNFKNDVWLHFGVLQDGRKVVEIRRALRLVHLKQGYKQTFRDGDFAAHFDVRAVYEPKALLMEERNYPSEYPILSRQISLWPYYFPFLDTVHYTFRKDLPNPKQVGIFKYSPRYKSWSSRYTVYDSASRTYKHRLRSSGIFALMRDTFAPKVYLKKLSSGYKRSLKRLVLSITDKGKGVDDRTLRVYLNGSRIDCEYDPDWRHVVIENLKFLKRGKNILKVSIQDYADNPTTRTFTFNLK